MYLVELFEEYYLRVNQNTWDEIYDPNFATSFESENQADDWVKENTNFVEYAKVVKSVDAIEKYRVKMQNGGVRRTFDFMDNNLSRKYNNESPEEVLKWWASIEGDKIRMEDYQTWPGLYQKFQNLYSVESYYGDDYKSGIVEVSIGLFFPKKSSYDVFQKELNLALPYVSRTSKQGYKIFRIFDYFCCEGGNSVDLCYLSDDDCRVGGDYNSVIEGSLKECFDYLVKYRYYE